MIWTDLTHTYTQFIYSMEYNSQLLLSNSQEARLAEGIEEGFLAAEWFNDFSENESETDDTNRNQAPFIAVDSGIEGEEGQNSEEWSNAMNSFGSRRVYNDRVRNFMAYAKNDASQITLEIKLIKYFDDARKMKTDKGEDRYRATSFRSWLSVFCKFWKHCKFPSERSSKCISSTIFKNSTRGI